MLVLEEETQVLRRLNVRDLTTNSMNRVKGQHICRADNRANRYRAAVGSYLPLVVADYAELQQFAEIFLQRKNLPNSPFVGEGLTGSLVGVVGPLALTVDLDSGDGRAASDRSVAATSAASRRGVRTNLSKQK